MGAVYRATDTKLNRDVDITLVPEVFAYQEFVATLWAMLSRHGH
jgi:hypothetical protein